MASSGRDFISRDKKTKADSNLASLGSESANEIRSEEWREIPRNEFLMHNVRNWRSSNKITIPIWIHHQLQNIFYFLDSTTYKITNNQLVLTPSHAREIMRDSVLCIFHGIIQDNLFPFQNETNQTNMQNTSIFRHTTTPWLFWHHYSISFYSILQRRDSKVHENIHYFLDSSKVQVQCGTNFVTKLQKIYSLHKEQMAK